MTFEDSLIFVYREGWAFVRRFWSMALLLMLPHAVFGGIADFLASDEWVVQNQRMFVFAGYVGIRLAEIPVFYVLIRFLALARNASGALAVNRNSIRTFAPFAIAYLVVMSLSFWSALSVGLLWHLLLSAVCINLFALWAASAPGGGSVISPVQSVRVSIRKLPWSMIFQIVAGIPFIIPAIVIALLEPDNSESSAGWVMFGAECVINGLQTIISMCAVFAIAVHAGLQVTRRA